jgi:hypothetical protein
MSWPDHMTRDYNRAKYRARNFPVVLTCPLPEFIGRRFPRREFSRRNLWQWPDGTQVLDPRTGTRHTIRRSVIRPRLYRQSRDPHRARRKEDT